MKLEIVKNYKILSKKAAKIVAGKVEFKSDIVLGLPTGSTPIGMYDRLIDLYQKAAVDFSLVTTFNLDEYLGIAEDHPGSFTTYMENNFLAEVNIKSHNFHIPSSQPENINKECQEYERKIKNAGGIDFLILGLGKNGHIGFNEPGDSLPLNTSRVKLKESTRRANSSHFSSKEKVPREAITMGIKTILSAREILLLISGNSKAQAVAKLTEEKITTQFPASLLHLHDSVKVLLDQEAGEKI